MMGGMLVVVLVIVGMALGSFVNALVWRVHEQQAISGKKHPNQADKHRLKRLSILTGRSMCLSCGHELSVKDLIPVFSWLSLQGKCRYCGAQIPDSPIAELVVPLLFVASYIYWPWLLSDAVSWAIFILWSACLVGFVALTLYDLRWYLLPNRIVFPLAALGLTYRVLLAVQAGHEWLSVLLGGVYGVILLAGLFYLLFVISHEQWIGGGDVKLAVPLGLLAGGPAAALLVLFLASSGGTLAAVPLLLRGKPLRHARIPFGPFLISATIVAVLFSGSIVGWYTGLFVP